MIRGGFDRPAPVWPKRRLTSQPAVVLEARVVTGCGGGPDKTILSSPRFLKAAGYRTICAYMHPPGDPGFQQLQSRAHACQAPLASVPDRGPWDWQVAWQMLNLCRRERITIWHGHDYKSNALGLLLRRFWPMHLVTTVHGWVKETRRTPLYYWIDRLCLPRYERVICVSEDLVDRCLACGVPADRCLLVENGIDTDQYARTMPVSEAKVRLGFQPRRHLVGAVGRLSAEKGFDLLIRVADRLMKAGLDLTLWILGEGDEKVRLQALIATLGRQDRIRLLGFQAKPAAFFQAMDAFVLSSLREGLPNVLLEAMAFEVPVVATRVAGVPRLIQDGRNGLLVPCADAASLADALQRLLCDPGLRNRLGLAGRQTVADGYSFQARMQKIRSVFDAVLDRPTFSCQMPRGGK
jgi:glycosyltransferase involved in cell wall biosynthesis